MLSYKKKIHQEASIMPTITVSLPNPMKTWIESQASNGQYSGVSDYIRDLIRRDQSRKSTTATLQAAITEGIESGISERSLDEIMAEARTLAEKAAQHED